MICVFTSSPDDSGTHQSLTDTGLEKFTPGEKEKELLVGGRRRQSGKGFVFQNGKDFKDVCIQGRK